MKIFNIDPMNFVKRRKDLRSFAKFFFSFLSVIISNYRAQLIESVFKKISFSEITLKESIFLGKLVQELETIGPIIEIGTLFGRSTLVIAANKALERKLITVDNYSWNPIGLDADTHYRITKNLLSEAEKTANLKIHRIDKNDFYLQYRGETPALVFFDAVHNYSETKTDIMWAKRINSHLICGHDYDEKKHPAVVGAVKEFGGPRKLLGSIWVL